MKFQQQEQLKSKLLKNHSPSVSQAELERWRGMEVSAVLPRLADYCKCDPTFMPIKHKGSERWHITARGHEFEILSLGPKFFDTRLKRGGGGAVDLAMHLLRLDFNGAVAVLREAL